MFHVSAKISCDQSLLCFLRVPVQLVSPLGFHAINIPKGILVVRYATVEVHPFLSGTPHLRSSIPYLNTDFGGK